MLSHILHTFSGERVLKSNTTLLPQNTLGLMGEGGASVAYQPSDENESFLPPMQPLNHLLVALDLGKTDRDLVKYVAAFSRLQDVKKIVFVHVARGSNLTQEVEWEGEAISLKEQLLKRLERTVESNFEANDSCEFTYAVRTGSQLHAILTESHAHKVDLIVLGKKSIAEGSGQLAKLLSRRAICSVMIVPQNYKPRFERILVPIDFSEHSKLALQRAITLSKKTGAEIIGLHVYVLPQGYHVSGKTKDEYAQIMKQNAVKKWRYFVEKFALEGIPIQCKYQVDHIGDVEKIVYNVALLEQVNIMMVGSRGMTDIAARFLGDTTEKLLMQNMNLPMMVAKSPEYKQGFFDALLNI